MPSFQITISPKRRAATRFIADVRRALCRAVAQEHSERGLSQSEIARRLDVHRSVISRELRGHKDIGLGRIGELSWALGLEPYFEMRKPVAVDGENHSAAQEIKNMSSPINSSIDLNSRLKEIVAA